MAPTELQLDLLGQLRSAVESSPDRRVVYRSVWLGYLPYGLYQRVNVGPRDRTCQG